MENHSPTRSVHLRNSLAPTLRIFLVVQLLLCVVCLLAEAFNHFALHRKGIYTYPLLSRNQTFYDFIFFRPGFQHFHSPEFFNASFPFTYPAPVAIALEIFFLTPRPLEFFIIFILGSFLFGAILLGRALLQRGVGERSTFLFIAGSLLLAFPLWFELKQGNIEISVAVVVAIGIWASLTARGYTAAACFGIAGAMKIFPFVYLGLLLSQRKYRQAAFGVFVAAFVTVASLWLTGRDIVPAWNHIQHNLDQFRTVYMFQFREWEIGFDHSLFAMFKRVLHHVRNSDLIRPALTVYMAVTAVSGVILYFVRIRHLPLINQVLCLCIASILLPPVSYDYTLIHLYVSWALLVVLAQEQCKDEQDRIPGLMPAFICFAVLMSPESEFIRDGVRFSDQIKALTLIVLMYIALRYPFERREPLPG